MIDLTAVVPARRETRRIENKNIQSFGHSNLLIYKLRQLKKVDQIREIVVSSDDDVILQMAADEGGVTCLKRPQEYSGRDCLFSDFVAYICKHVHGEHIMWACVTAPFITAGLYDDAIQVYEKKLEEGYDSLITVQMHKRFIMDRNGTVNFKKGARHVASENLPEMYLFTNGIQIAPREKMIKWRYTWGHIPFMYEVDKKAGIDISDPFDYNMAKLIWKQDEEKNEWEV